MSQHANFIHLHVHTTFSLSEGLVPVKKLASRCAELRMPAVAMTDTSTLAGAALFDKSLTGSGVQPIVGAQVAVSHPNGEDMDMSAVVLLAQNETGYDNLVKLISLSYLRTEDGRNPNVTLTELRDHTNGLILLTGGASGPVDKAMAAEDVETAKRRLGSLKAIFGDRIYLEIQRTEDGNPHHVETRLVALADEFEIPLVATNAVYFLNPDDHDAHDALLCVAAGAYVSTPNRRRVSADHYLATPERMREIFKDLPDACDNTLVIAKRCAMGFKKQKPMLPAFPGLENETEEDALRRQAAEGLVTRLEQLRIPEDKHGEYRERLEFELDVIVKMGFPGYFLIVADFINWAKSQDIPVGPGRGSGAGSLVAYSIGITDLDPIRYELLFERFLNPDRVSMPDFDVDFCQQRREEVIEYVRRRYGAERVAQIGTFGKMNAKAAVRDIGRVLQLGYNTVDRYARLIPGGAKPTPLAEAMEMDQLKDELAKAEPEVRRMFELALKVEGAYRHSSTHAAGVVIANGPVHEIVPVMRDANGIIATNFDMKAVEDAGLVKFDFLGLKTLDIIDGAVKMANGDGAAVDFDEIGVEDEPTYRMIAEGDTFGVFQLESPGMRSAERQIAPDNIDDVIALVSLYRPGPLENIPKYANVKHGRDEPNYLHKSMEPVLQDTFGIIVYQEQVMRLARELAGYSLGQADILRRAMGKKIKEEMDKQRGVFTEGAKANGIDEATASAIFDLIARFADYGFNRSHAAAYAVIAFRTAFLKRHLPHEFYASSMNLDISTTEKLAEFFVELKREKLAVLGPDINASQALFSVQKTGSGKAVRWALAGVRGVGIPAMEFLVAERKANGPFKTLSDFVERTVGNLNKRAFENLIRAGALDRLPGTREAKLTGLPRILKRAQTEAKEKQTTQTSLFDLGMTTPSASERLPDLPEMSRLSLLNGEFETLGVYLSGHPLDTLEDHIRRTSARSLNQVLGGAIPRGNVKIAVLVNKMILKTTRNNEPMAVLLISDATGNAEVVVFPSDFQRLRARLGENSAYIFDAAIRDRDGERQILVNDAELLPLELCQTAEAA